MGEILYYTVGDDLTHHGILGMKWGRRNGPPYPLGAGDHSSAEKKAGTKGWSKDAKQENKKKSVTSDDSSASNKRIGEYRRQMVNRYSKSDPNKAAAYKSASDKELQDEYQRRKDTEKAVLITAGVVGISAACYLAYRSGVIKQLSKSAATGASGATKEVLAESFAKSLDDLDYVISKDSVLHRMSAFENFDLSKTKGKFTYVTITEKDRLGYMAFLKDWHGTGKRYDVSLKATKDIIAPSDKTARKIFDELWNNDPSYRKELITTVTKARCKIMGIEKIDSPEGRLILDQVTTEIKQDPFKQGIYSFVKGSNDSKKLADAYKEHGYSALVDYFDKGTMGQQPMILFNASSDVVKTGEKFVTQTMKAEAMKQLGATNDHPLFKYAKAYAEIPISMLTAALNAAQ